MGDPIATRADIAMLYGRCGFGATAQLLDTWAGRPYVEAVDALLAVPDPVTRAVDDVSRLAAQASFNKNVAQHWWLERMRTTAFPLEERMVLFWHDHFATGVSDEVTVYDIVGQNQTLRLHALGSFRELAYAMTIDPAMLKWLNGNRNVAAKPNENYARELLELFTMGVLPRVYTEADIQEAARALTGWNTNLGVAPYFQAANHDTGEKTILGETFGDLGDQEYKRVVDIALDQQVMPGVAARFIAYKLVQHLAYAPDTLDLFATPDPLVDEVAAALEGSGWSIRAALRTMLLSDHFRLADEAASRQHVLQPVEVAVRAAKVLGVQLLSDVQVANLIRTAGQVPFEPPNVGGWPVGRDWLSQTAIKARYEVLHRLTVLNDQLSILKTVLPPTADIAAGGSAWAAFVGLAGFEPSTLAALQSYVATVTSTEADMQNALFILAAMAPEWQVM